MLKKRSLNPSYMNYIYNKSIKHNLKNVLKYIFENEFLSMSLFSHFINDENFLQLETIINNHINQYPNILNYIIKISKTDKDHYNLPCILPYWEYHKDINKIKIDINHYTKNKPQFKIKYINELPNVNKNIIKYQDYIYYKDIKYKMDGKIIYDIFKENSIYDNINLFLTNLNLSHFLLNYLLENKLYDEYINFVNDVINLLNGDSLLFIKSSFIESLINYSDNNNDCYYDRIKYTLYIKR
jgi:hypothetical protein